MSKKVKNFLDPKKVLEKMLVEPIQLNSANLVQDDEPIENKKPVATATE